MKNWGLLFLQLRASAIRPLRLRKHKQASSSPKCALKMKFPKSLLNIVRGLQLFESLRNEDFQTVASSRKSRFNRPSSILLSFSHDTSVSVLEKKISER